MKFPSRGNSEGKLFFPLGETRREAKGKQKFPLRWKSFPYVGKSFPEECRGVSRKKFPRRSPFSGIVHHLSGPNRCAHTQTSQNRLVGCWCKNPSSHFHYVSRFGHPGTCTYVRLLGPCFKTGRVKPFCHHLRVKECTLVDKGHCNQSRGLQSRDEFCKVHSVARKQTTIHQEFSSTPN